MVAEPRAQSPLGRPAPHGNQSLPRAKNMPGFGSSRAMTACEAEEETSNTAILRIFDVLPVA